MALRNPSTLAFPLIATLLLAACNAAAMTPTDSAALPDLIIRSVYIEMEGRDGPCVEAYTPYEMRVVVENSGAAGAGPFAVTLNGERQEVEEGLAAGETILLHFASNAPNGQFEAVADADDQVVEAREDNNSLTYQVPTPTPPPLCTSVPNATP